MYRTLCNLEDATTGEACLKILNEAFKNTEPSFLKGKDSMPHFSFLDLDQVIANKETAKILVDLITNNFKKLCKYLKENEPELDFNKVAIIDKGGVGPVGLIPLMAILQSKLDHPMLIIQNQRSNAMLWVKGDLKKGDKILLLDDISETGMMLHLAMMKIIQLGACVPATLTVVDKSKGASENLEVYGTKLFSIISLEEMYKKKNSELERLYKKAIMPDFRKEYIDFSGYSVTRATSKFM